MKYFRSRTSTKKCLAETDGRQCPRCRNSVIRDIGCDHMTCLCRHEFCYVCGAPSKRSVCQSPCPGGNLRRWWWTWSWSRLRLWRNRVICIQINVMFVNTLIILQRIKHQPQQQQQQQQQHVYIWEHKVYHRSWYITYVISVYCDMNPVIKALLG